MEGDPEREDDRSWISEELGLRYLEKDDNEAESG